MKRATCEEQFEERKNEIISVVNKMFDEMDYQDITMKTISEKISIARSSLYCYYKNKEEIMLDILKNDYISFFKTLITFFDAQPKNNNELAKDITNIYINHMRLLEIISIHLVDIEIHVSLDRLIEFKSHFVTLIPEFYKSIEKTFAHSSKENIYNFFNSLMMLTHSLYPMVHPHENQIKAMKKVGMPINEDAYAYCYQDVLFITSKM